jgi:serine phosphatase RsbU (regulator of sigma subunit)
MKKDKFPRDNKMESFTFQGNQQYVHEHEESLKYASCIQQAIFPSRTLIFRNIPESFIFYQPREVVSGDFYYVSRKNDYLFIAVGDCTGHGVPGAFMSILGITFLNEIIQRGNFSGAGSILNKLREHVMAALSQTGEDSEQKDGMDISLCIIDARNNRLNFAGAFNPVYIVRDQQLLEISGDMMPVGIGAEEEKSFRSQMVELHHQDTLYLFTDGFADQFGGPSGRKFKYAPFRKLLIDTSQLPMYNQEEKLKQTFNEWKGNNQQLDDVLIFGFRYQASVV